MSFASDLARLVTSGSTAIHGEAGVTSSGSTGKTTNLQQGLCKVWVKYDGEASGAAAYDSFNVGSMTDNGTGDHDVTFTNAFSNVNYCVVGVSQDGDNTYGDGSLLFRPGTQATTGVRNSVASASSGAVQNSLQDAKRNWETMHGDLA